MIFEDELFSKKDALKLLEKHQIVLLDDFTIIENSSSWSIGDYIHSFELEISVKDKNRIIEQIKKVENFKKLEEFPYVDSLKNKKLKVDEIRILYYENKHNFVIEYYKNSGEGIVPIDQTIFVEKNDNILHFIEIDN
jgi:hypothetical protein